MADNKALKPTREFKKSRLFLAFTLLFSMLISSGYVFAQDHHESTHESHDHHAATSEHEAEVNHDAENHAAEASHGADAEHHEEESEYNAGVMIFEHISDAHSWHLWGHTEIGLPVIIYDKEKGLIGPFSSKHFDHGHASHNGYKLVGGKLAKEDGSTDGFYNLSISKNVFSMMLSVLILILILFAVRKAYIKRSGKAPKGLQSVVEPLIVFLRDEVIKPSIGKGYERFTPLLLTIFFFIFANNLLGLIPLPIPGLGANVSGNIAVTAVLAIIVFIVQHFVAKRDYWLHVFWPDVPHGLKLLLVPIEIFGVILKPVVLALRLFANITAGHIIILGFFSLIFIFGQMAPAGGYGAGVFSMVFVLFMSFLELLVAFLQAYVFTLLAALYFGSALEEHHHDDHSTEAAH